MTGDVDMGYGVGEVELFAVLGGLWFGETRSRKRVLETERFITLGGDLGESIIHSSGGDTINSVSVLSAKEKKVGEVCVLGVGVIDIILYRMAGKASLRN